MLSHKQRARPVPMKPERWWGVFNFGNLVHIDRKRRDAWAYVDACNPGPDSKAEFRRYYTVEPLVVSKQKVRR